jgi:cytoskeletal protein RodZ
MATEALKKFADELKSAREDREVTLKQIFAKTRIDLKFLQAIENADFNVLPDLYIKAFIKEYAQQIDLNPQEILQKYENAKSGRQEPAPLLQQNLPVPPVEEVMEREEQLETTETRAEEPVSLNEKVKFKLNPNYFYIGAGLILLLIFIYLVLLKGTSPPDIVQEKNYEENALQNKPRFEVEKTDQGQTPDQKTDVPVSRHPDSLRLQMELDDRVWTKVISDGKIVHQQYDLGNSKLNFAATKYFSISIGNAGAVKVFYNNKPVKNIGKKGEIRNIYISPDTIRYLTITPAAKNEKKPQTAN